MNPKQKRTLVYTIFILLGFVWGVSIGGCYWLWCSLVAWWLASLIVEHFNWDSSPPAANQRPQKWNQGQEKEADFYRDHLEMLPQAIYIKLARAAGPISSETIQRIQKADSSLGNISQELILKAVQGPLTFSECLLLYKAMALEPYAAQNGISQRQVQETCANLIFDLFYFANCDGEPSVATKQALQSGCHSFGFDIERVYQEYLAKKSQGKRQKENHLTDAYSKLGCTEHDSDTTIRGKYRELVKSFHPDVITGKDLPPAFVSLAEGKFKEIQQAYETVMQSRCSK